MSLAVATEPGVHPTAVVDPSAHIGAEVAIGPFCVVGPRVSLGEGVRLLSHVHVTGVTSVGAGSTVYPGAVLGAAPQDFKYKGGDTELVIGAGCTIREHVTMHVGTEVGRGRTVVGEGGLFMVGAHVAHDCIIGDHVTFANNATLGGHVVVEDRAYLGGLCAVHQHTRIGAHAFIGGGGIVTGDVIPFGLVDKNGDLAGLNLVGLKRRGFDRDVIHDLRTAYRLMFATEGTFQERVDDAATLFAARPEVGEIIAFIRAPAHRPLCTPETK